MANLDEVREIANLQNIKINPDTIKPLHSQGLMSHIYEAESENGPVVIHLGTPTSEQKRQDVPNKIHAISRLHNVPGAKIFGAGYHMGKYFIVQQKLDGVAAGHRAIKEDNFIDVCNESREIYLKEALQMLAELHKTTIKGFGPIKADGSGMYGTWKEFLENLVIEALNTLEIYQKENNFFKINSKQEIMQIMFSKANDSLVKDVKISRLIHGDMINFGNILVKNGHVAGIIDYEWGLGGDPPYEFAFTINEPVDEYIKLANQD